MLKFETPAHRVGHPLDAIPHTTAQLIDRAAGLGYHALAVTLHDRQLDPVRTYSVVAAERGITLIPGPSAYDLRQARAAAELQPRGRGRGTFDDLRALKRANAASSSRRIRFSDPSCLGRFMDPYADLFDAVEYNAMFTPSINFNARAVRWATRHRKPLVGNGDVIACGSSARRFRWSMREHSPTRSAMPVAHGAWITVARPITSAPRLGRCMVAELVTTHVRRRASGASREAAGFIVEHPSVRCVSATTFSVSCLGGSWIYPFPSSRPATVTRVLPISFVVTVDAPPTVPGGAVTSA